MEQFSNYTAKCKALLDSAKTAKFNTAQEFWALQKDLYDIIIDEQFSKIEDDMAHELLDYFENCGIMANHYECNKNL